MRTPRQLLAHLVAVGEWSRAGIAFPPDLDLAALRDEIREVLARPERPERQVLSEEEVAVGKAVAPLVQAARRRKVG